MKITIIDYVKNKMIHKQATFYFRNGKGMYIWEGKEYTPQEFKKAFPIFGKLISYNWSRKPIGHEVPMGGMRPTNRF